MNYLFKCSFRELKIRRNRTFLTIIGYGFIVSFIMIISIILSEITGSENSILKTTGTHLIAFQPGCGRPNCSIVLKDTAEGLFINGTQTALIDTASFNMIKHYSSVKDASPFLSFRYIDRVMSKIFVIGGFNPSDTLVVGSTCCASTDLIAGSFMGFNDRSSVLLNIGYSTTAHLRIGDSLKIGNKFYTIAGIINPNIKPVQADIYLNISEAVDIIEDRLIKTRINSRCNGILIEVKSSKLIEDVLSYIKKIGLTSQNYRCYKPASIVMDINEKSLWILLSILFCGLILFSFMIQLSSVIERAREIAILRTIGWSIRDIVILLFSETFLQSITGVFAGLCTSLCILFYLNVYQLFKLIITFNISNYVQPILIIFFSTIFSGFIAGIIPSIFAVYRKPAEVLRRV